MHSDLLEQISHRKPRADHHRRVKERINMVDSTSPRARPERVPPWGDSDQPQLAAQLWGRPHIYRGFIHWKQPIYIPYRSCLERSIVQRRHLQTLHGGVSLTMAAVREDCWIPRLRSLVKAVRKDCNGCRKFQAVPMQVPAPGSLPEDAVAQGKLLKL